MANIKFTTVTDATRAGGTPADGEYVWTSDTKKFYRGDGATLGGVLIGASAGGGSGDVTKVGTPANNQVGVWTGDGTIEGDAAFTFDTTNDSLYVASQIELGHASDTTITRASAGVIRVEGVTVTRTIASGTAALGTSSISSGASASVVTVAATGVATTDVIDWGFNGTPNGVTGYNAASTTGCLVITAYPTAGNVNFIVSNPTAGSITPGAVTLNWSVRR